MRTKNNIIKEFYSYLDASKKANHEASFLVFEKALSEASEAEQADALGEMLRSNSVNIASNYFLKDAFVTSSLGQALRAIFKKNPNLLYSKEGKKYKFLDDVVKCDESLIDYVYENIQKRKEDNIGEDFSKAVLNQAVTDNEKLVLRMIGSSSVSKKEATELLEKAMTKNINLATEMIKIGIESPKTAKFMKNNFSISDLEEMLSSHISAISPKKQSYGFEERRARKLTDSLLKEALIEYISKEKEKSFGRDSNAIDGSSSLLARAINTGDKKLVCDMALIGFKLDKNSADLVYGNNTVVKLAQELRDNKNYVYHALGYKSLTDNDAQRIALLSSSGMSLDAQKQYLKKHKGVSPLKLAIDTEQFDIATEMIARGDSLKLTELSVGDMLRTAVGLLDIKEMSAFKLAQSKDPSRKEMKFTEFVKEKRAKAASNIKEK